MQTNLFCHSAKPCGQPAIHVCAGCQRHYCGEHFLRASFIGAGLITPVTFDTCHACMQHLMEQQHRWGRTLSQWQKVA
jgi:hypothetical protein